MKKLIILLLIVGVGVGIWFLRSGDEPDVRFPYGASGVIKDEAMHVGRTAATLPGSDDDYLRDMDVSSAGPIIYVETRRGLFSKSSLPSWTPR